jgi:glycine/serine hydroxymethyltransferase
MREIGNYIARVVKDIHNEAAIKDVKAKVEAMAGKFPLYPA